MRTYSFTLLLDGPDVVEDEDNFDALMEAGCDDALIGERDGIQYAAFDREAESFTEAVAGAMKAITGAVRGLRVTGMELDDDALLTVAKIASRVGVSREYVRKLVAGERGPGQFPPPANHLDEHTRLWRWSDVAPWLSRSLDKDLGVDEHMVALTRALNGSLAVSSYVTYLDAEAGDLVKDVLRDSDVLVKKRRQAV